MCSTLLDFEDILSENEHWSKLDEEWGTPIDLDNEEPDFKPPAQLHSFSTCDSRKPLPTFDSAIILQQIRKQMYDSFSKQSVNYKDFLEDLDQDNVSFVQETQKKQFYFVGGQIISAASVNEICENIDKAFNCVSKLGGSTSTIRAKAASTPRIPEVVECSMSIGDLSFDDTNDLDQENSEVDRFIDELFEELDQTIASVHRTIDQDHSNNRILGSSNLETSRVMDQTRTLESVTTLVKKFSSVMNSPVVKCSPRRKRQCCDKFRNLAEFWQSKAMNN